jgi:hypothetical protein
MINIDDLNLQEPIIETDEFLIQTALKHKLPSLLLSSIVLARLMHINQQSGSTEDFKSLMQTISVGMANNEFQVPDKENLH